MFKLFPLIIGLLACFATPISAQTKHGSMLLAQAKPWLGVAIDAGKKGVLVKEVIPGTPAEEYGLKAGDEITAVNKDPVKKPPELIAAIQAQGVGNMVDITFERGGVSSKKSIRLIAKPDELEMIRKKLVGKPVPKFDLPVISGSETASSEKLRGRAVLVEIWATWCPACRSSHPRISAFAKEHPEIAVIGFSEEDKSDIKAYADEHKLSFTVAQAPEKMLGEWMASSIPMLIVINKTGIVTFATFGAGTYLEEAIAEAIKASK